MKIDTLDQGRLTVAADLLPLLRANGLDAFDKIMASAGGTVARDFPGRRTVRLELKGPAGTGQGIYLKRYEREYLPPWRRLLRRLHWPGTEDEAGREWRMLQQVSAAGLRTARAIALGQDHAGGACTRSFLMTAEIAGAIEGHAYAETLSVPQRRQFVAEVAEMARRFHGAGFVHKDFYVGHVLVAPGADGPELFLIDLQRVMRPCCWRERWIAKDLGAMAYSLFNAGATYTDLLRGFQAYGGWREWGDAEKRLARKIMRRVLALRRRQPKHGGPVRQRT
jgi:heptose I phosphotransferase